MKQTVTILMVIGLILGAAVVAAAGSDTAARVKIPFAFHAGEQLMPAGEYWVEMPKYGNYATGSLVKVASVDNHLCQILFSQPDLGNTVDNDWHITFSKVGDHYFLAGIQNNNFGAQVSKSRTEKTLARELATGDAEPAVIHLKAHAPRSK